MSVNFNSTYFQSFVDFAQQRVGANDAKAVISATVTQPLGGRTILAIDQSKTDSVHKWTRGFDEWKVNDDTRKLFKQAVALLFGGPTGSWPTRPRRTSSRTPRTASRRSSGSRT